MKVNSPRISNNNQEAYNKVIKTSFILNEIGSAIKTRRFPIVMRNLGLSTNEKSHHEEQKKIIPTLKLADDTFKTLPSLRNSSYQTYRQSSNILNEYQMKAELPYSKVTWGPETIIAGGDICKIEKPQRTQIIYIEELYTPASKQQSPPHRRSNLPVRAEFTQIFERIKRRSEARASAGFSQSQTL